MQQKLINIFHVTIDPPLCSPHITPYLAATVSLHLSGWECWWERLLLVLSSCCQVKWHEHRISQLRNKPVLFVDFYTHIVFLWGSLLCLLIGKNNNKTTKMSTNMTKWMTLMFLFSCWFKSQGENYLSNECGCTDVCNIGFTRTLFTVFIHHETGDWKDGKAKRLQVMHFNASNIFIKWN